ncbi:unannotated protein [freshwater metagenome]|uniref:Unannotated protein n=1 Tax=freshwater metagenome TaxID=449393 RepID=A0A6J7S212_9ZZZZ
MNEHVAFSDHGEDRTLVCLGLSESWLSQWRCRSVTQLGVARQLDQLPEVGHVEQPRNGVDLTFLNHQRLDQLLADCRADSSFQLQPHYLAERPLPQLGFDRLEQVVGLVGDVEIGVACNAEATVIDHFHLGEEPLKVGCNQLFEQDEA